MHTLLATLVVLGLVVGAAAVANTADDHAETPLEVQAADWTVAEPGIAQGWFSGRLGPGETAHHTFELEHDRPRLLLELHRYSLHAGVTKVLPNYDWRVEGPDGSRAGHAQPWILYRTFPSDPSGAHQLTVEPAATGTWAVSLTMGRFFDNEYWITWCAGPDELETCGETVD